MDRRRWSSWLHFLLWLLFLPMGMCRASVPVFSPFFFMCTHHGAVEDGRRTTEVAMSLRIAGNPKYYVPGRHYEVTLTTSADFNGLLVTGLYTSVEPSSRVLPELAHNPRTSAPALAAVSGPQPFASGFVCSIVTSHVAPHPQKSLSFVWEAPPTGTGCVSFMATATLHGQVIFKDTMVQQLCEQGAPTLTLMTPQLEAHGKTVVLREDFHGDAVLDKNIWKGCHGCQVDTSCGHIMHGQAVVFCQSQGLRQLTTTKLNTTSASALQFTIGSGSCRWGKNDPRISLYFSRSLFMDDVQSWTKVESIRLSRRGTVHIVPLPQEARAFGVTLRWQQDFVRLRDGIVLANKEENGYQGCWALDNVLVVNGARRPAFLQDDMDPMNTDNWLFFPGAVIKDTCQSDGECLYFPEPDPTSEQFALTRDLDLSVETQEALWEEDFEEQPFGWVVIGGSVGEACGVLHSGKALVLRGIGRREVCTPVLNATAAGSLRFHFTAGGGACEAGQSPRKDVTVFAEPGGGPVQKLEDLQSNTYLNPGLVSLPIPAELMLPSVRFCLRQAAHDGLGRHAWAIDAMRLLPRITSNVSHLLQFSLNLGCDSDSPEDRVAVEYSTNEGRTWAPLHYPCLPFSCQGHHWPYQSSYSVPNYGRWTRVVVPLPLAALTLATRFRWRHEQPLSAWGIDNVYIGPSCPGMCMGRGRCSLNGCSCDVGFYGDMCEITKLAFMAFLSQSFSGPSLPLRLFHTLHGATLGLSCGLLAEGKALVFNGGPYRELVTTHLDTTVAKFLQFTLRLGTTSGSSCPAPDHSKEGVLLDFSTNNGLTWQLLAHYHPAHYHEPRIVSLELPSIAQHNGMQLRWWQPHHSGEGQDVWALDELTVTSTMYSAIYLDFSDLLETTDVLSFFRGQLQPHCGHDSALSFTGETWEGVRYVETQSLAVSSSFMLQFEFVANCDSLRNFHQMNPVRLEFSTNHGLTWSLVQQKCLPGMPSCDEFRAASEFYPSQFKQWQRVTMALPAHCWSSSTRFRWQQGPTSGGKGDMWALDDLYIGQACPAFCHNHGHCNHGTCRCDEGFVGSECLPREWSTPQFLHCDFESAASLFDNWIEVAGGNITRPEEGCGLVTAGSALFFHKDGVRHAVTRDFDTSRADFVQFTVHIGGNSVTCNIPDRREEGVLLQFSTNGGISWRLLIELYYMDYSMPRFVHQELPTAARGPCTRFRWWQPQHSGDNKDQWSIDSVIISSSHALNFVPPLSSSSYQSYQSEFPAALSDAPVWLDTANEGMPDEQPFCSPRDSALVFGKSDGDRFAITRDFEVLPGFVLQFQLNIGCDSVFKTLGSVHVQFSCDTGRSWSLVQKECYPATLANQGCEGQSRKLHEASVYPAGIFPHWTRVTIPLPHTTANRKTRFRWFQHSSMEKVSPPFALDQVYVAHPCPMDCAEHVCSTDSGETCVAVSSPISDWVDSQNAVDRFEGSEPGPLWKHIHGGRLGGGCGQLGDGVALYFSGAGKREAVTVPLDTSNIRMMQFYIRIGSQNLGAACLKAKARNEGVVLQFSRNGDVSWSLLRELDFASFLEPQLVTLELPPAAKGVATYFRWWQPQHGRSGAQWALDDVLIGVNDSSLQNLQDKFEKPGEDGATWFRVEGGHIQSGCSTNGHVLLFDSNSEKARLAETWDVHVSSSTFLQFELSMGCGRPFSKKAPVELQFSVNFGRDWQLVRQGCVPPDIGCTHYETSSVYQPGWRRAWSRIMLYLPYTSISSRTRFRWIQHSFSPGRDVWALDNVYIGSGCPWMCSGHGACDEGQCRCDMGFKTPYCVPLLPLPYLLKETFDSELKPDLWFEVLGSEIGQLNGQLISSGSALIFNKDGLRMLVTKDLDCSKVLYIQFTFCFLGEGPSQRSNGVLLQFSINGGISWQFLEELYMPSSTRKQLVTITLPHGAQTNATRFRLWQPRHKGPNRETWALDNFVVDGNSMKGASLLAEDFENGPHDENWLFLPGGHVQRYCPYTSTGDMRLDPHTLVFLSDIPGEHSITTRDLHITESTIIQFEISVGCTMEGSAANPVHLEFSRDFGASWHPVQPQCQARWQDSPLCSTPLQPSSKYYMGSASGWWREVIHVGRLQLCGLVRFRWYQGFYPPGMPPLVTWAIDNIYIGPQCEAMCSHHGMCIKGSLCICDKGYSGMTCEEGPTQPNFLVEDFEGMPSSNKFLMWSGGKPSRHCGLLLSGSSLYFGENGLRMLVTADLDLSHARFLQFFLRLGCSKAAPNAQTQPLLLQFSTDGGQTWTLLQELCFLNMSHRVHYVALEIPLKAAGPTTQLRWWHPSRDGYFHDPWAIDQIVVGGSTSGLRELEDNFSTLDDHRWLLHPGASISTLCRASSNGLAFINKTVWRYAVTSDLPIDKDSFLQFDFVADCDSKTFCYSVELEFSLNFGQSWNHVRQNCLPTSADCNMVQRQTFLVSDMFSHWTRVTLLLPPHTWSSATRLRWKQDFPFDWRQSWAIDNVYIGDSCLDACTGRGHCSRGSCICDDGWSGVHCDEPTKFLPSHLKDSFSRKLAHDSWQLMVGGHISNLCGAVASGSALHFTGHCSRHLESVDLNLTQAVFVQFHFMFGCLGVPHVRDHGVLLDFSINGGVTWMPLAEMFFEHYRKPGFVNILLPATAQVVGVRLRWWQPKHDGAERADWALDNIFVSGSGLPTKATVTFSQPGNLLDQLLSDAPAGNPDIDMMPVLGPWMFWDGCHLEAFCSSPGPVLLCGQQGNHDVMLTSHDVIPNTDWIVQLKIVVACLADEDDPVHLQLSTDYGESWEYVQRQCLSTDPTCSGKTALPSAFFPTESWRRATFIIPPSFAGRPIRVRLLQSPGTTHWAIDDFYMGPACGTLCSDHGDCWNGYCICDATYTGDNCSDSSTTMVTLKERFESVQPNARLWTSVEGGSASSSCGPLSDGLALCFRGGGARFVITVDLDLRGAKYIEYWALIGSSENQIKGKMCRGDGCQRDSVLLDFSTDGGFTWTLLYELDLQRYSQPRRDLISLPQSACSPATRLRWWQSLGFTSGLATTSYKRAYWALDDVLVGGWEINPSMIQESFQHSTDKVSVSDNSWTFYPHGELSRGTCGNPTGHMAWTNVQPSAGMNAITTRELIITSGFMVQFRIVVGCKDPVCSKLYPVTLEYSKDQRHDEWQPVRAACLPAQWNATHCTPFMFHEASEFSAAHVVQWTRITLMLPEQAISSGARLRWMQSAQAPSSQAWAIDDVYIGEACPGLCSGHGMCIPGAVCVCDKGYGGDDCFFIEGSLPNSLKDGFENERLSKQNWGLISGGHPGHGCGQLGPYGHGKALYFSGCHMRVAITLTMDLTLTSKLIFVLQIGSAQQNPSCFTDLESPQVEDRGVLLQFSVDGGLTWLLLASHSPRNHLRPRRLTYDLPIHMRVRGVIIRWWQPHHGGSDKDQWAIDNVEFVQVRRKTTRTHSSGRQLQNYYQHHHHTS